MRTIINLVLAVVAIGLIAMIYSNVSEPIKFEKEKNRRVSKVVNKLKEIRDAQELYRSITGAQYADSFQKLRDTLTYGQFLNIRLEGDPDDPTNPEITRDTTIVAASDSIPKLGINLDSLAFIPFSKGKKFSIAADTIQYQKTLVNVVEVKTQFKDFMGPFSDERYKRYDEFYDPESYLKFGDMTRPNLSGNWER